MTNGRHYVDFRGLLMKEVILWHGASCHKVNGIKEIGLENHNLSIVQPDDIVVNRIKIDSTYIK